MTRSETSEQLFFDSEIEKTTKRLRKEAKLRKLQGVESSKSTKEEEKFEVDSSSGSEGEAFGEEENFSEEFEEETMAEQTLRQLHAPQANQQPLCITYPNLQAAFELKSGLIHYLPKFHGMESENPHNHVKEFHAVCSGMSPQGITEEQVKLRAFPFSLQDAAKDWFLNVPSGSITTWDGMTETFLEKYFLASRAAMIRREISGIKKKDIRNVG